MQIKLSPEQKVSLEVRHRTERDSRIADRIKAVLLSDKGWTNQKIAEALLIHRDTVSNHLNDYLHEEKLKPENGGSKPKLEASKTEELIVHLEEKTYTKVSEICAYVQETYGLEYTIQGMTSWLHSNGFSYKQPAQTPAKADFEKQETFKKHYADLLKTALEDEPILFMDAVHPTMATKISYGWIRTGKDKAMATTASRTRLNIIGALNLSTMDILTTSYLTINGESVINFLKKVLEYYKDSTKINIILDNGSYHVCAEVADFIAKNLRIKLHFLPPYSPNLNPIERLWKVMNEYVRNNKYFASAREFSNAIHGFFKSTWPSIAKQMTSRINDNFQTLNAVSSF